MKNGNRRGTYPEDETLRAPNGVASEGGGVEGKLGVDGEISGAGIRSLRISSDAKEEDC